MTSLRKLDNGSRHCKRLLAVAATGLLIVPALADAARPGHHSRHARTWYVQAGAKPPGAGTRRRPFAQLARVERSARPGDTIVVLASRAPLLGGIVLKPRQRLVGAGPAVASKRKLLRLPWIENTGTHHAHGDGIELANHDTVRNLVIGPTARGGIYGSNVAEATIAGNALTGTNTSCTTGFVVQPFTLPSLVSGAGVPFSSGLPNGWAAIMLDQTRGSHVLRIRGNYVHDGACADGIDIRAMKTARVTATVSGNTLTRLHQGPSQQSVLAIGVQTIGTATLAAKLSHNTETYIGSATVGDEGNADSEGLFANGASRSHLVEHVDHNTFAHGLGHLSANCFEVVSSNGGPTMNVSLSHSTCNHVVGDVLEAVNLSRDATMAFAIDHVIAENSEFVAGPAFHQVEPGDDGDCLFELGSGAHNSTTVSVTHSVLSGCVTDGLEVAASVDDGKGPVDKLAFDVRDSTITANRLSNLRVANSSPVTRLDGRISHTNLAGTGGTPIILENVQSSGASHVRLDFGGGPLGSPGDNCIFGGTSLDVEDARDSASAEHDWWGRAGGPPAGAIAAVGGNVSTAHPLARAPRSIC